MLRPFDRSILAGLVLSLGLAAALSGCAPGAIIDKLPGEMALPTGTPERPVTAYEYPAVHDMPPPRATPTMSEEQQVRVEKELAAARDRQEARDGPAKKTGQTKKKKPATANTGQAAGAQDGAKTNP